MTDSTLTLYDDFVPELPDGEYAVSVTQAVNGPDGPLTSPLTRDDLRFVVRGPRFALPAADVHRVHPPADTADTYDAIMPMVVFNRRILPWEREIAGQQPPGTPWIALVVFTADELPPPAGSVDPRATTRRTLRDFTTPPSGTFAPTLAQEDDEDFDTLSCDVIEIPATTFCALLPTLAEARYLTHVRVTRGASNVESDHDGWYSTVVSNRFGVPPTDDGSVPARVNIAHVVSLEGFEDILGASTGHTLPTGTRSVRMISLFAWTFTCRKDPAESFSARMQHLTSPASAADTGLLLRAPSAPARGGDAGSTIVADRLRRGYVALAHRLRDGQRTFAWYRGPCVPEVVTRFLAPTDARSPRDAGSAMIFDPATGLFDQSYAVAWEAGRLLALSSQSFATSLMLWRRQAHAVVDLLLARIRLLHPTDLDAGGQPIVDALGQLTPAGLADMVALCDANLVTDGLVGFLTGELFASIAAGIGKAGGFTPADTAAPTNTAASAPTTNPIPALKDLMESAAVTELLNHLSGFSETADTKAHASILPDAVLPWLARLALLRGVSLDHLVPDAGLLANESIRFFALDPNWIDALVDGALSVGVQSSRDGLFHRITRDPLHRALDRVLDGLRADAIEATGARADSSPNAVMGGFLLRSSVVRDYRGLEVRGYYRDDGAPPGTANPMRPLRYERLGSDILLCIFPRMPLQVDLDEPSHGVVFGVEDEGVDLRAIRGPDKGKVLDPDHKTCTLPTTQIPLREGGAVNIGALVSKLRSMFPQPLTASFGPAAFALQMIRRPERKTFTFAGLHTPAEATR